jgi:membrane-bound lytic murein transglycosylase D
VKLNQLINRLPGSFYKMLLAFTFLLVLLGIIRIFSFSSNRSDDDELYKKYFKNNYRIFSVNIPNDLNFCNELVPIQDFEVRERIDREFLINTYWQSQTLLFAKRANRWFPVIVPILKRNGVPEDFKYLALAESGFTLNVSSKEAAGFWQFIPGTAQSYGLAITDEIDERYHLEKSTEAACKLLKEAHAKFNNWTLTAAAYNIGINGLARQLERQHGTSYYDLLLNEETARYVFRILALKEILSHPREYGFIVRKKDLYPPIPTKLVFVDTSISNLATFAEQLGINYKLLKYFNPWLRTDQLSNPEKTKYPIKLPIGSVKNYDELMNSHENGKTPPAIPVSPDSLDPLLNEK